MARPPLGPTLDTKTQTPMTRSNRVREQVSRPLASCMLRVACRRMVARPRNPGRPSEWSVIPRYFRSVNRHCRKRPRIGAALTIFFALLCSLNCLAQPSLIPSDLLAKLVQEQYGFPFSEQPNCSRVRCSSPNGGAFAVIVPGGGEKIAALDRANGISRPMRGDGIVVHRADGRTVRLPIHSVSDVDQENWSSDGRYLIVSLIDATGHGTDKDLYYYDTFSNATKSINALSHHPRNLDGFALHPLRVNWIIVRWTNLDDNKVRLFVFDLNRGLLFPH